MPVLLDDNISLGINFKSFDIIEILGHGAFGKVFKCKKKVPTKNMLWRYKRKNFFIKKINWNMLLQNSIY